MAATASGGPRKIESGAGDGALLDTELAPIVTATIHPAAILRSRDDEARHRERARFTEDLRVAVEALEGAARSTA